MSKTRLKIKGLMILAVTEPAARQALKLLPVLKAELCPDAGEAVRYLSASAAGKLLIICPRPEIWVGRLLADGVPPAEAVRRWSSDALVLLELLRGQRQRITLIFEDVIAQHWKQCAVLLGAARSAKVDFEAPEDDPLMGVIARKTFKAAHAASAISSEVGAYAFVPEGAVDLGRADPTAMFVQYQQMRQSIAQSNEETLLLKEQLTLSNTSHQQLLSAKDDEISRLNQLLLVKATECEEVKRAGDQLADELSKQKSEATKLQQHSQASKSAVTEAQQKTAAALKELTAAKAYSELLRQQVALDLEQGEAQKRRFVQLSDDSQKKIEALQADHQKTLAKAKDFEGQVTKVKAEVEALKRREAELLTARGAFEQERDLLREQVRLDMQLLEVKKTEIGQVQHQLLEAKALLKSKVSGAQKETEVAMKQLLNRLKEAGEKIAEYQTQVQALSLERSVLQGKLLKLVSSRDDMATYVDRSNALSAQVEQLQADFGYRDQTYQAELAAAHQYSATLRDELANIHRSISYRTAAPLRGIRRVFKPQGK